MADRRQEPLFRDDDRERMKRARQAAEALFTPKQEVAGEHVSASPADPAVRKPRVLGISPARPIHREQLEAPASPAPPARREIPQTQFARIRSWVKYGMTISQVAEVYGAAVGEIERILRRG